MRIAAICSLGACAALAGLSVAWSAISPPGAVLGALWSTISAGAFALGAGVAAFGALDALGRYLERAAR